MNKFEDLFEAKIEIEESKDDQVLARIKFPWGKADSENKNKRTYPFEIFKTAVEKLSEKIKRAYIPGMLDHPLMGGGTRLGDVSHILKSVWLKDKVAWAEADILKTSKGKDSLRVIKSGVQMGASLRGFGEVKNGKVQKGLEIASVDLVANPSFGDDTKVGVNNIVIESIILNEEFFSLRDSLQTEIVKEFGKQYWVVDFSDKEVVFRKEGTEGYKKISYKTKGDDLELTGEAVAVTRKIQYEGIGELSNEELRLAGIYAPKARLMEQKVGQRTKEEGRLFTEAVVSGFLGTFDQWKEKYRGEDA